MFSRTIQFTLIAIALCFGSIGATAYLVSMIMSERVVLEEQVTQIAETESQQATFIQLNRIADDTADERATLVGYFLPNQFDSKTILLLNDIEEVWGPALGVEVEPATFQPLAAEPHPWFVLNYQLTGTPAAVRDMLLLFEAMPYHAQVDAVTIRDSETAGQSVAEITVRVAVLELL